MIVQKKGYQGTDRWVKTDYDRRHFTRTKQFKVHFFLHPQDADDYDDSPEPREFLREYIEDHYPNWKDKHEAEKSS